MGYQDIKNTIDLYNSKANDYLKLLKTFDFQGFLKASAQIDTIIAHHTFFKVNPLSMAEIKSFSLYNGVATLMTNQISNCFSDKFPIKALEELVEQYESIPEKYRQFVTLKLSDEELAACHKVLESYTTYALYGKEKLLRFKDDYLSSLLAKSIPFLPEQELQRFIGTQTLTEKQFLSFKQNGYFPEGTDLTYLYESFGLPTEKTVSYAGVKAAGTTFKTKESDMARQDLLATLDKRSKEGEKDILTLTPYIYTDSAGSRNAVAVYWGKEDVANLPQAFVDTAYEAFEAPTFTVTDYEITGGYSARASYGIKMNITVSGISKEQAASQEITEQQTINPMNI